MIPIAFVQSLANVDDLERVLPFLKPIIERWVKLLVAIVEFFNKRKKSILQKVVSQEPSSESWLHNTLTIQGNNWLVTHLVHSLIPIMYTFHFDKLAWFHQKDVQNSNNYDMWGFHVGYRASCQWHGNGLLQLGWSFQLYGLWSSLADFDV
jgi:hypothetical protein